MWLFEQSIIKVVLFSPSSTKTSWRWYDILFWKFWQREIRRMVKNFFTVNNIRFRNLKNFFTSHIYHDISSGKMFQWFKKSWKNFLSDKNVTQYSYNQNLIFLLRNLPHNTDVFEFLSVYYWIITSFLEIKNKTPTE